MIKVLEEQDFEIMYGEEISDEKEILFEISSDEERSNEELLFMMTNNSQEISHEVDNISQEQLQAIWLGDVIGEEKTFTDEELAKFEKMKEVVKEIWSNIIPNYSISQIRLTSSNDCCHWGGKSFV